MVQFIKLLFGLTYRGVGPLLQDLRAAKRSEAVRGIRGTAPAYSLDGPCLFSRGEEAGWSRASDHLPELREPSRTSGRPPYGGE